MHRLAAARGWRSVGEMLDGLAYSEIISWAGYYELEGWPEWRADVRSALICSVIANCNRNEKIKPEPFLISDFMLSWTTAQPEAEPEEGADAVVAPDVVTWLFAQSGALPVLRAEIEAEAEEGDSDGR